MNMIKWNLPLSTARARTSRRPSKLGTLIAVSDLSLLYYAVADLFVCPSDNNFQDDVTGLGIIRRVDIM